MKKTLVCLALAAICFCPVDSVAEYHTIKFQGQVLDETNGSLLDDVWVALRVYDYELMKPVVLPERRTDWLGYFSVTLDAKFQKREIDYTLYKDSYQSKTGKFVLQPDVLSKLTLSPLNLDTKPASLPREEKKSREEKKDVKTLSAKERVAATIFAVATFLIFRNQTK